MVVIVHLSANIDGSLSLKLMNLLMPVFSMNLAKNFTPISVTSLLESAVAAILPDLENCSAIMGIDPTFVFMK